MRLMSGPLLDGTVLRIPDPEDVVGVARDLQHKGVEALAICFFNSYRNPSNEELTREWIEVGQTHEIMVDMTHR